MRTYASVTLSSSSVYIDDGLVGNQNAPLYLLLNQHKTAFCRESLHYRILTGSVSL